MSRAQARSQLGTSTTIRKLGLELYWEEIKARHDIVSQHYKDSYKVISRAAKNPFSFAASLGNVFFVFLVYDLREAADE